MLRVASAVSRASSPEDGAAEVGRALIEAFWGSGAEVALVFARDASVAVLDGICAGIGGALGTTRVVGCAGYGVIGPDGEIERGPGLSALALAGDFEARSFLLRPLRGRAYEVGREIGRVVADLEREPRSVLLFADSYCLAPDELLAGLASEAPGAVVFGAGASEAGRTGQTRIAACGAASSNAVAGLALGGLAIESAISQGCAPLGPWRRVTRAEGHRVLELDGGPAAEIYLDGLPGSFRSDLREALRFTFAGVSEVGGEGSGGERPFVVRRLLGIDPRDGAVLVGDEVLAGAELAFLARDAAVARASVQAAADELVARLPGLAGALYIKSVARGASFYRGAKNIDLSYLRDRLGEAAIAGVFSGLELAPLSGRNRFHEAASVIVGFAEGRAHG